MTYDDETGLGTVTVTEHAGATLGDVVFVELPQLNTKVAKGGTLYSIFRVNFNQHLSRGRPDQIGAVESVKAASDIVE